MKNKPGLMPIVLIGAIVIAITVVAFFLLEIERTDINIVALGALLLAEIVFFGGLIMLKSFNLQHDRVFAGAGVISASILYLITTVISILFVGAFSKVSYFVLLQLIIIAIFAVIIISVIAFARRKHVKDIADAEKKDITEAKRGGF